MQNYLERALKILDIDVSTEANAQLEQFIAELLKWNKKLNLTAITDPREVAVKHIADSLVVSDLLGCGDSVLDIGSGAGFPGIPLAITRSDLKIVTVDAVAKKIQFQKNIVRLLALHNLEPIHTRIECYQPTVVDGFDVIISRAFTRLERFVELARPFMKKGGRIVAMKGPASIEEIMEASKKLQELGLEIVKEKVFSLPFDSGERSVIVLSA